MVKFLNQNKFDLKEEPIMGIWGLGIEPNPQSPIPNPQSPFINYKNKFL